MEVTMKVLKKVKMLSWGPIARPPKGLQTGFKIIDKKPTDEQK